MGTRMWFGALALVAFLMSWYSGAFGWQIFDLDKPVLICREIKRQYEQMQCNAQCTKDCAKIGDELISQHSACLGPAESGKVVCRSTPLPKER